MSSRADEVKAGMYPGVMGSVQGPPDLELLLQIVIKLLVNIVNNGAEAVSLVDLVAISHCVNDRQLLSNTTTTWLGVRYRLMLLTCSYRSIKRHSSLPPRCRVEDSKIFYAHIPYVHTYTYLSPLV